MIPIIPSVPTWDGNVCLQRKHLPAAKPYLSRAAANALPLQHSPLDPLLADNLGQRVSPGDAVKKPEGIAEIALARGVGAHQQGEVPQRQRCVEEVLEPLQPEFLNHGSDHPFFMQHCLNFFPLPQGQGSFRPTRCWRLRMGWGLWSTSVPSMAACCCEAISPADWASW